MRNLGKQLTEIRKSKGLSQEALAQKSNLNIRTIQRIENGENEPNGYTLNSICNALDIDIEEISNYGKTKDKTFLIWLHLSIILSIAVTFILWLIKRDKIEELDTQGKNLLLFRVCYRVLFVASFAIVMASTMHTHNNFSTEHFTDILFYGIAIDIIVSVIYPIYVAISIWKGKRVKNYYPRFFK